MRLHRLQSSPSTQMDSLKSPYRLWIVVAVVVDGSSPQKPVLIDSAIGNASVELAIPANFLAHADGSRDRWEAVDVVVAVVE